MKKLFILSVILLAMPMAYAENIFAGNEKNPNQICSPEIYDTKFGNALDVIDNDIKYGDFSYSSKYLVVNVYDGYEFGGLWYSTYTPEYKVDLSKEVALQKQAIYDLKQEINSLKAELCDINIFSWCIKL